MQIDFIFRYKEKHFVSRVRMMNWDFYVVIIYKTIDWMIKKRYNMILFKIALIFILNLTLSLDDKLP